MTGGESAAEWKRHWPVVLGAMLGYSCIGLQSYAVGPFIEPIEGEFGWSRVEVMAGLTVMSLAAVCLFIPAGFALDRFGSRRVALTGQVLTCVAFGLLATASGGLLDWSLHWLLLALGLAMMQGPVWTRAITGRFEHGRGLAIAGVLTGSSITAALAPFIATALIEAFGWRAGFAGTALCWLLFTLPFSALLFFDPGHGRRAPVQVEAVRDRPRSNDAEPPRDSVTLAKALRRPAFWIIAGGLFSFIFYTTALAPNLVPLLRAKGLSPAGAAKIVALVGLFGFVSRLFAGHLLDRFPSHIVASTTFLLPLAGMGLMLAGVSSVAGLAVAVAIFGATIGAENNVIIYLIARHFGLRGFAVLLSVVNTIGAVAAVIAPVSAGWIYDSTGGYDLLLTILCAMMGASALTMLALGPAGVAHCSAPPEWGAGST